MPSQATYERLEAYGFGVDYPSDCVIELDPKSKRSEGDIALKSPSGYKLFLSWGDLEKVKKLNGVDAHADYSVDRIKGGRETKVRDVRKDSMVVNGHRSAFREVDLETLRRGTFLHTSTIREHVRSLHVHCDVTGRYFVIYGPVSPDKSEEQGEVLSRMVKAFVCHGQ